LPHYYGQRVKGARRRGIDLTVSRRRSDIKRTSKRGIEGWGGEEGTLTKKGGGNFCGKLQWKDLK